MVKVEVSFKGGNYIESLEARETVLKIGSYIMQVVLTVHETLKNTSLLDQGLNSVSI